MSQLDIRLAHPDDRLNLIELQRRASLASETDEVRQMLIDDPGIIDLDEEMLANNEVFVAERGDRIVGFATIIAHDGNDAELEGLFVEPSEWRQGIATDEFSGVPLTAAATLVDPEHPAVAVSEDVWSVADFVSAFPATFDGYVQLRLVLGTPAAGTLTEDPYDTADIRVDVRVVAATNRTLEDEVRAGRFREDLFYRLNVLPLKLPPLRAHREDLPALIAFYIEIFNREFKKNVKGVSDSALRLLSAYGWPGNVRELRNAVERAMLLTASDTLEADQFPQTAVLDLAHVVELPPHGLDLEEVERSLVIQALDRTQGNQTRAAKLLGLNRDQIHYRIEKFKLATKPARD